LEHVEHELFPEVVLVGDVDESGGAVEFYCDFAGDEVEGVDVALVDHLGGVEEHVLLVAEGLNQESQQSLCGAAFPLEDFGAHCQADDLFDEAVHDVVPPVFGEAPLNYANTTTMN